MQKLFAIVGLMVAAIACPAAAQTGAAVVGKGPGVAGAAQTVKITATITAIDPAMPSITFTGPNNWKYSTKVQDKDALSKVKVGDKVDITWTEAMVASLE